MCQATCYHQTPCPLSILCPPASRINLVCWICFHDMPDRLIFLALSCSLSLCFPPKSDLGKSSQSFPPPPPFPPHPSQKTCRDLLANEQISARVPPWNMIGQPFKPLEGFRGWFMPFPWTKFLSAFYAVPMGSKCPAGTFSWPPMKQVRLYSDFV